MASNPVFTRLPPVGLGLQAHSPGRCGFVFVCLVGTSLMFGAQGPDGPSARFSERVGPEIFESMKLGLPNQTLERTGLGLRVLPWSFGFAHVRTPVAQLYR